jgi:hypothetical protein
LLPAGLYRRLILIGRLITHRAANRPIVHRLISWLRHRPVIRGLTAWLNSGILIDRSRRRRVIGPPRHTASRLNGRLILIGRRITHRAADRPIVHRLISWLRHRPVIRGLTAWLNGGILIGWSRRRRVIGPSRHTASRLHSRLILIGRRI